MSGLRTHRDTSIHTSVNIDGYLVLVVPVVRQLNMLQVFVDLAVQG